MPFESEQTCPHSPLHHKARQFQFYLHGTSTAASAVSILCMNEDGAHAREIRNLNGLSYFVPQMIPFWSDLWALGSHWDCQWWHPPDVQYPCRQSLQWCFRLGRSQVLLFDLEHPASMCASCCYVLSGFMCPAITV